MKPTEIYQELKKKDCNASVIAEALSVLPQSVATVIRTGKGSKRVAIAVAVVIDKPLEEIFPYYAIKKEKKSNREKMAKELKERLEKLRIA